jgi:putative oxygen-independent coproporphyrinogen III oxidase
MSVHSARVTASERALTVYVGIPFCRSKCHFCRYVADVPTNALVNRKSQYGAYVDVLIRQIDEFMPRLMASDRDIASLYFGGGTPTVLTTEQLIKILEAVQRWSKPKDGYTITLETTPEAVFAHDFVALRRAGFNRISMGVQSMQDQVLRNIGRSHSVLEVPEAVRTFTDANFENINIDLMFGLPGESTSDVADNLEKARALTVNHYSVYLYEPDPRTVMARQCNITISSNELLERFELVHNFMVTSGYKAYNSFYYTKDDRRCEVDEAYYCLKTEWVGLGAGAHSLIDGRMYRLGSDSVEFIKNPLTLGPSAEARANSTFLYTLSIYMFLSDVGIIFDRFRDCIGITFDEALALSPELCAWYERADGAGHLTRDERHVCFASWKEQARFFCDYTARRYAKDILKSGRWATPYGTDAAQ